MSRPSATACPGVAARRTPRAASRRRGRQAGAAAGKPAPRPANPALRAASPALRAASPALRAASPALRAASPALRAASPALRPANPAPRRVGTGEAGQAGCGKATGLRWPLLSTTRTPNMTLSLARSIVTEVMLPTGITCVQSGAVVSRQSTS